MNKTLVSIDAYVSLVYFRSLFIHLKIYALIKIHKWEYLFFHERFDLVVWFFLKILHLTLKKVLQMFINSKQ